MPWYFFWSIYFYQIPKQCTILFVVFMQFTNTSNLYIFFFRLSYWIFFPFTFCLLIHRYAVCVCMNVPLPLRNKAPALQLVIVFHHLTSVGIIINNIRARSFHFVFYHWLNICIWKKCNIVQYHLLQYNNSGSIIIISRCSSKVELSDKGERGRERKRKNYCVETISYLWRAHKCLT